MDNLPDVQGLVQQTQRYEFSDGLRDLQLALLLSSMGVVNWLIFDYMNEWVSLMIDLAARFGVVGRWSVMFVVMIPAVLALFALLVIRIVRRRWLWRASGYVKARRWLVPRRVTVISFIIILVTFAIGMLLQSQLPADEMFLLRLLLVASSWSFGYTLIEMGRLLDLPRYLRAGILGSAVTTLLLFLPLTVGQTSLLWGLLWGILLTVSAYPVVRQAVRSAREASYER